MPKRTCTIEECNAPHRSRGFCENHYRQMRKRGMIPLGPTPEERFWAKVDKTGHCWEWTGCVNLSGYGHLRSRGQDKLAHRMAWELTIGPIPDGLVLDHRCFNPVCVKPDHLRVVTTKQNIEHVKGLQADNTSGARNVHWCKQTNSWAVTVTHDGKHYWGGRHGSLAEADVVARALRAKLFSHDDHEEWASQNA